MKLQVQEIGGKPWFGGDLLELQSIPLLALKKMLQDYGSCVLQGCEISGGSISEGYIFFTWLDGSVRKTEIAYFSGYGPGVADDADGEFQLVYTDLSRMYKSGVSKVYAREVVARFNPTPSGATEVLSFTGGNVPKLLDVIQGASRRFVKDTDINNWNGKLGVSSLIPIISSAVTYESGAGGSWSAMTDNGVLAYNTSDGWVHIDGAATQSSGVWPPVITLPSGFRPYKDIYTTAVLEDGGTFNVVPILINTAGLVTCNFSPFPNGAKNIHFNTHFRQSI